MKVCQGRRNAKKSKEEDYDNMKDTNSSIKVLVEKTTMLEKLMSNDGRITFLKISIFNNLNMLNILINFF